MVTNYKVSVGGVEQTPEQYAQTIKNFNTPTNTPVGAVPKVPEVITSDLMKPAQGSLVLPESVATTPSTLVADGEVVAQTALEKRANEAQKKQDTGASEISKLLQDISTTEGKKTTYQEDAGVFSNKDKINEIDDQLLVQSRALKAKNDQIKSNPEITQSMASRLMSEEERKAASTTADLMVTRSLLNRDVDRAIAIADRKVEAELAPQKAELEAKKFLFDNNKDWLSTLQKTALQNVIDKEQRAYNKEENTKKQINNLLITAQQNGADQATINAIKNAKNESEAAIAIGVYATDPLERKIKQAQLNKLNQDMSIDRVKFTERNGVAAGGVSVNGTNPEYTSAINTILGSAKFSKDQASAVRQAIQKGEDPFTVIKNNAKSIMGQTLATDLDKAETAKGQLEAIDRSLKQYYANGGDTGIFKGNYEKTLNKLGDTKDPELVGIATEIALAMQAYRLAVTGTAASVQEDARIDNVFPGITSGQVLNNARTQATIKSFDTKIDQAYRNTLGSNYDTLKKNNQPEIPKLTEDEFVNTLIPSQPQKSMFSIFNRKFK